MRHAQHHAREWLRYLSTLTTCRPLRDQLRTTAHALHLLPAELRGALVRAAERAELELLKPPRNPGL